MTYFVEIRSTTRRTGAPKLIPLSEVAQHTGFRSVFAYSEEVSEQIRESGNTRDLQGISVYSDTLFVDFDDKDPAEFRSHLVERGVEFEAYTSGNRSIHFHIKLSPMEGPWVPFVQKNWMKDVAPTADLSFYHAAGQFRLPRTYHAKTGQSKELIETHVGSPLTIFPPKPKEFHLPVISTEKREEDLMLLLTQRASIGGRSMHLFKIAVTAAELGHTPDQAMENLRYWNDNFAERPHGDSVLIRNCVSAFERVCRRAT